MQYDISLTPAQLEALYEWAEVGGAYPAAILLVREGENIVAGQGDARVRISPAGDTVDNPQPYQSDVARGDGIPTIRKSSTGGIVRETSEPEPESTGARIHREAREMYEMARDVDYDPAAEDEDGVPIFSDATRAAAQDDPRGERDR